MKVSFLVFLFVASGCSHEPVELVTQENICQMPMAVSLYLQNYYCGGR